MRSGDLPPSRERASWDPSTARSVWLYALMPIAKAAEMVLSGPEQFPE
jgi:hypothetical protein